MDCKNCELKQRQFFCQNCLRTHLRDLRLQTHHFATDRDDQIVKATKALEYVQAGRIRRASVAQWQDRLEDISTGLARLKKDNEKKRDRLRVLRETLARRRRTLSAAKLKTPTAGNTTTTTNSNNTGGAGKQPTQPPPAIARELQELNALSETISRARSGLVQELVEVFNVVEVGGRPPIGGKGGTKGEWSIEDLILPVPGDIRRYPPDHMNAVITHTIHFLSLLTFYLGIKLPFEITWTGKRLGVGQPFIGAIRGGESGGWAKWYTKHPLHISAIAPTASTSARQSPAAAASGAAGEASSFVEDDHNHNHQQTSFTTALAMLHYNVCYLASTQKVDVPLSQAGDVLCNLWSVCCSPELGRSSNETLPLLPPPTPQSFTLDFNQLLQATTAKPPSKIRARTTSSGSSSSPSSSSKAKHGHGRGKKGSGGVSVIVEEDGWDLVDDENFG